MTGERLMIQWKRLSPVSGQGDFPPTRWKFTRPFSSTFAVQEKGDAIEEERYWGWIYTGSVHEDGGTYANGLYSTHAVFARWGSFYHRAIAIGPV